MVTYQEILDFEADIVTGWNSEYVRKEGKKIREKDLKKKRRNLFCMWEGYNNQGKDLW